MPEKKETLIMGQPSVFKELLESPNPGKQSLIEMRPQPSPSTCRPVSNTPYKSLASRSRWKSYLVGSAALFSIAPILVLSIAAEGASQGYLLQRDCYPNGMWSYTSGATWRIMDSSYFFTPNLAFGSFTFTAVKVIDISWDLLVGRGGQLLLAYVTYRVFNESLLYYMESHPTSYKLFTTVAFEPISLSALGVLGKEVLAFGDNTWRRFFRWLTILCMLLATLYVLAFPTLMSAMTGYTSTYTAYIENNSHDLIEFDKFTSLRWIIQDSFRIGSYDRPLLITKDRADDDLAAAAVNYTNTYGLLIGDGANKASFWMFNGSIIQLDPPLLNCSAWAENPGHEHSLWTYEGRQGTPYNWTYMLAHGSCQPGRTYQWGFSYIFLFMMSIFNCVWSFIVAGMWLDTYRKSRMYRAGRRPGLLRSVMDLSGAIREELGEKAQDYSNDELKIRLRDCDGAMLVPEKELRVSRTDSIETLYDRRRRKGWHRIRSGSSF